MKRLWWILAAIVALPAGAGGVAAWAVAHRGYPDAVYYSRSLVTWTHGAASQHDTSEEWQDPDRLLQLMHVSAGDQPDLWELISVRQGTLTTWSDGRQPYASPLASQDLAQIRQDMRIVSQGPGPQATLYLARAAGNIAHGWLDGRPVLFLSARVPPSGEIAAQSFWLDTTTRNLAQEQTNYADGTIVIEHYLRHLQRLAPGTLPADFFAPPRRHTALWDQVQGWLRDHTGIGR